MEGGHGQPPPGVYPAPPNMYQQHMTRPPAHQVFPHNPQPDSMVPVRFVQQQGHQMPSHHLQQQQQFYQQHPQPPGYRHQQYSSPGPAMMYPQQVPSGYPAHELPGNHQARFMYPRNSHPHHHDDYRQQQQQQLQHMYCPQQQQQPNQSAMISSGDPNLVNSQQQVAYRPRFYPSQTHPGVQQQQQQRYPSQHHRTRSMRVIPLILEPSSPSSN